MRSHALERGPRIVSAARTALAFLVALAGLAVTWRSEGDLVTLAGALIALGALPLLPRPERWRALLSGPALLVPAVVALSLLAAAIIVVAALLGFDGTTVSSQSFEAPR
jgi:hypothetical protein